MFFGPSALVGPRTPLIEVSIDGPMGLIRAFFRAFGPGGPFGPRDYHALAHGTWTITVDCWALRRDMGDFSLKRRADPHFGKSNLKNHGTYSSRVMPKRC
jgi:hypothetical protein